MGACSRNICYLHPTYVASYATDPGGVGSDPLLKAAASASTFLYDQSFKPASETAIMGNDLYQSYGVLICHYCYYVVIEISVISFLWSDQKINVDVNLFMACPAYTQDWVVLGKAEDGLWQHVVDG